MVILYPFHVLQGMMVMVTKVLTANKLRTGRETKLQKKMKSESITKIKKKVQSLANGTTANTEQEPRANNSLNKQQAYQFFRTKQSENSHRNTDR
jgi:hypothetical protein